MRQQNGRRLIEYREKPRTLIGPEIPSGLVWLRSQWGSDGSRFHAFGAIYQMTNAHYRGDRVGLYSYGDSSGAGHVDADYFRYDYTSR